MRGDAAGVARRVLRVGFGTVARPRVFPIPGFETAR